MKKSAEETKEPTPAAVSMAKSAQEWVASPAGQLAVREGMEQARRISTEFREAQRVDPEILHKPVTL